MLLDGPSGGLVDVDLDCPESLRLADTLLPPTGAVFGRAGKPRSHRLFVADPLPEGTAQFQAGEGEMLVELRSTGGQTVFPPSAHESGEAVARAVGDGVPARVDGAALRDAVATMAGGCLLVRHYLDKGGRHNLALALSSVLLRSGRPLRAVEHLVRAVANAAGDEEVSDRVGCVAATDRRLRAGGRATGVPTLKDLVGDDPAARALDLLGVGGLLDVPGDDDGDEGSSGASSAGPAGDPARSPPDPLGDDAYHGVAGAAVRAVMPHTEADPVAVLLHLLAGFGNLIGRDAHFRVGGAVHTLNLFVGCVGGTAKGGKGTAQAGKFAVLKAVDPDWVTEHVSSGLSSGEGLIWALRDPIYRQETDRKTGESREVLADPGVVDKRLLVVESELASVPRRMGRDGNTPSAILRQAWDAHDLRVLTKTSAATATEPHISVVGHVTANELRRELTGTEAANGFANRFLWACVAPSKLLPEGWALQTADLWPLVGRLKAAAAYARDPRVIGELRRDDAARELWSEVYGPLSAGRPGLFGAVTGRAEA